MRRKRRTLVLVIAALCVGLSSARAAVAVPLSGKVFVVSWQAAPPDSSTPLVKAIEDGALCGMSDGWVVNGNVFDVQCVWGGGAHAALLTPDVKLVMCFAGCQPIFAVSNELKGVTTLAPGATVTVGRFRCLVAEPGVECFVISTGSGFRLGSGGITRIGPPPVPAPRLGKTAVVQTVSGSVTIELPGTHTFVPLATATSVPLGTTIDATAGTVQLASAADNRGHTQTGRFYSGAFRLTQTTARSPLRGGRRVGITVLTLTGGVPTECGAAGARADAAKVCKLKRLWGNGHGNFHPCAGGNSPHRARRATLEPIRS